MDSESFVLCGGCLFIYKLETGRNVAETSPLSPVFLCEYKVDRRVGKGKRN